MKEEHTIRARKVPMPDVNVRTRRSATLVAGPTRATSRSPLPETVSQTDPTTSKPWSLRRGVKWAAGVVAVMLIAIVGYGVFLIIRFQNRIYVPLPPTATVRLAIASPTVQSIAMATDAARPENTIEPIPDAMKNLRKGRFIILVLGTDKRENDPEHYARSDTLLLANVDTVARTVGVMSIPRDLIMEVPGYGKNKVNAAYLFGEYYQLEGGGQALAVQTISQFFNTPIDYYVAINFDGFRKVVDTVGGVDLYVPYSLDDYNYPSDDEGDPFGEIHVHFDEGWQHMDGKTALRYARTRHADNDFARSRRQLQIILAVRQKAMSLNLIPVLPNLIDDLGGMVQTNIPFDQQLGLAQLGYNIDASKIYTASIDGSMILPETLPDGSEGLKLDIKVAEPILDQFFGWDEGGTSAPPADAVANPTAKTGTRPKPSTTPTRSPARH